jgi:hypothetical protein
MNEKGLPSRPMNSTEGKSEVVMKQKRGGLHHKEHSTQRTPILESMDEWRGIGDAFELHGGAVCRYERCYS